MITTICRLADEAAQDAFHRRQLHHERTGQWDARLTREYRRLQMLADMARTMERKEDAAHEAAEFDPSDSVDPLPDVPLADPGDHFVWPAGVGR